MSLDTVRVSQTGKEQLIRLKRHTGLKHWNELCRWALCASLAEATMPAPAEIPTDSTIEMSWKVFGGSHADLYRALVRHRCATDNLPLDDETIEQQFRLHLHRGIGYLFGDQELRSISSLVSRALVPEASDRSRPPGE
jgi:DNA sulfur modification protein DndE